MQQVFAISYTSKFAKKGDLAILKSDIHKQEVDKLEKVPSGLNNLKSKVEKLDLNNLAPVPTDLSKLSDVVKNEVVKKYVSDELVRKVNAIDSSVLVKKIDYNTKINEIKDEIPSITGLATTAALNDIKQKIADISDLVKKQIMIQK